MNRERLIYKAIAFALAAFWTLNLANIVAGGKTTSTCQLVNQ